MEGSIVMTYIGIITHLNGNTGSTTIYLKALGKAIDLNYQDYPKDFIPHQGMLVVLEQDRNGSWRLLEGIDHG